jgi:long-chain acyl-CoA synthetase
VSTFVDPDTAIHLLRNRVQRMPEEPLFAVRHEGQWRNLTAIEAWTQVEAVARGLIAAGIRVGDRVAIMSDSRHECLVATFALWSVGATVVPLPESASLTQLAAIAADARVAAAFVEDDGLRGLATQACPHLVGDGLPWVFADDALGRLAIAGGTVPIHAMRQRRSEVRPHDLATILYSSRTTDTPRGARLTHESLTLHARNTAHALRSVVWRGRPRLLLAMSLSHADGLLAALVGVASRTSIAFSSPTTDLGAQVRSFRPTYLTTVPRVLEQLYGRTATAHRGRLADLVVDWARDAAIADSRALQARSESRTIRVRRTVANIGALAAMRRSLGGRLHTVIVVGGPLHETLAHFSRGAGVEVLESYGVTETCGMTTLNRLGAATIGSAGPSLPGCEVRIGGDGQILVSGQHLFEGYEGEPPCLAPWLDTGDVGHLDSAGNLYVSPRAGDTLATSAGVQVAPEPLECALRSHPLVAEAVVVGQDRPFLGAILTLDEGALATWCRRRGRTPLQPSDACRDREVRADVGSALTAANSTAVDGSAIREFTIVDRPLPLDRPRLTPGARVCRDTVMTDFSQEIQRMFETAAISNES